MELKHSIRKLALLTGVVLGLMISPQSVYSGTQEGNAKITFTFGVVPQKSALKLARSWLPVLKYLSSETGHTFRFKTAPSIPEFEKRVADGEYDMAYMNPYHYVEFSEQPGYRAFAKEQDKMIRGIVVVRKDSDMSDLAALDGEKMAFPAPAAFAASILPRAHLKEASIYVTPSYVSSHDSVYMAVANGLYRAGGGVKKTFTNTDPYVRDQLKVLWTTEAYTSHALAAHPDLDPAIVANVTELLVNLRMTIEGVALLENLAWKGVEAAADYRWDDVRSLDINLLNNQVAETAAD